jgi:hypothetical protein
MIIKRVDLKKLKINGAECKFDKAELIISFDDVYLGNENMFIEDRIFEWNIEAQNVKSHVDFEKLYKLDIKTNLNFETIDGYKVKAQGVIDEIATCWNGIKEIGISVEDWAVLA